MTCRDCEYFDPDHGVWTATGWTGDGSRGDCTLEPTKIKRSADDPKCRYFGERR